MTISLIKATQQTCPALTGYPFVPVDLTRLHEFTMTAEADKIHYLYGGKDPNLGSGLIDFPQGIDCSGWDRTVKDYATHSIMKQLGYPDGSYQQAVWCINNKLKCHRIYSQQDYLNAVAKDGILRTGFHFPNGRGGDSVGHVFNLLFDPEDPASATNGITSNESYGGHGPGERPYTHQWFLDHCDLVVCVGPLYTTKNWWSSLNPYVEYIEGNQS